MRTYAGYCCDSSPVAMRHGWGRLITAGRKQIGIAPAGTHATEARWNSWDARDGRRKGGGRQLDSGGRLQNRWLTSCRVRDREIN
ncbi:hypothetical protein SESBI_43065 [Sesbania bispinosa]|nr:hypothetical protein SESBI_43065 [Sesbania bispinosa]